MIEHVVRQERRGGLWLLRDQGRVEELGPAAYAYLAALAAGTAISDGGVEAQIGAEQGQAMTGLLHSAGLFGQTASGASIRHVPLDCPSETLPEDACAAPKRIYFEMTRACNLACRSCFNASRYPLPGELSKAEVLEVNRQAWALGVFEIRYTGGECTTLPWFPEVVADARRRGFYISMGSNGVYTDAQIDWLVAAGVDWLIVSLDGGAETNDWVRGPGTFERVVYSLRELSRRTSMRLRINMVVARHNLKDIEAVARVAEEYSVEGVNLIPLRPYGRSLKRMAAQMFDQHGFYDFIREVDRLRRRHPRVAFSTTIDLLDPQATTSHDLMVQKKQTCAAGVEACVIGPRGHVYGCSYSPASFPDEGDDEGQRLFVAGNLREESLGAIWRDSQRWQVFRDLERYKHPKCHGCAHYAVRCSGSCPIMAWYEQRRDGGKHNLGAYCDPYCFVDLLENDRYAGSA